MKNVFFDVKFGEKNSILRQENTRKNIFPYLKMRRKMHFCTHTGPKNAKNAILGTKNAKNKHISARGAREKN